MASSNFLQPTNTITRSNFDAAPFDTLGRPYQPNHKTKYYGLYLDVVPTGKQLYLTPPHRCGERLKPTLLNRRILNESQMYTYSVPSISTELHTVYRDKKVPDVLENAMADVSRYEGRTILKVSCYADAQLDNPTPDQVTVHIRRTTEFNHGRSTERATYITSLNRWIAASSKLSKHQWYQELEDLMRRRTDRAFFNVQVRLNEAVYEDVSYDWFDPDIFGDSNKSRPIVWFNHPDRKESVRSSILRVPRFEIEDNEYDQRCPICLDPYGDEQSEQPAKIPCICGKVCGEKCLVEWLLMPGSNSCPQCGSHISTPIYHSPYTGGLGPRLPTVHRQEYSLRQCQLRVFKDMRVSIKQSDSRILRLLFFKESLTPAMSVNINEAHRFLITDPAPLYDPRKDVELYGAFHDALCEAVKQLVEAGTELSGIEIFEHLLKSVTEILSLRFGNQSRNGLGKLFGVVFAVYFQETCQRAATLLVGSVLGGDRGILLWL